MVGDGGTAMNTLKFKMGEFVINILPLYVHLYVIYIILLVVLEFELLALHLAGRYFAT
jgi:hypothetical protein